MQSVKNYFCQLNLYFNTSYVTEEMKMKFQCGMFLYGSVINWLIYGGVLPKSKSLAGQKY